MAAWSTRVLRRIAEKSPMGTATSAASTNAVSPSSSVAAR